MSRKPRNSKIVCQHCNRITDVCKSPHVLAELLRDLRAWCLHPLFLSHVENEATCVPSSVFLSIFIKSCEVSCLCANVASLTYVIYRVFSHFLFLALNHLFVCTSSLWYVSLSMSFYFVWKSIDFGAFPTFLYWRMHVFIILNTYINTSVKLSNHARIIHPPNASATCWRGKGVIMHTFLAMFGAFGAIYQYCLGILSFCFVFSKTFTVWVTLVNVSINM